MANKKFTKTWKLGEICRGGIITVETLGNQITIIGKDWDFAAGSNRGSNQSNAKEWTRMSVYGNEMDAYQKMNAFLNDLTHSGAAGKIMKWIESKVEIKSHYWS